ncbi:hypothetical protein ZIOFF_001891 [Zingiber officinale]|uniref:Uncharacterized protein n=1 Tax=Zingiber officinale TaxID=94328 RepID=A0A8J5M929_ZINOF|nr:hypothetical protein ZIOFF_001891 [Zingiber officinale]
MGSRGVNIAISRANRIRQTLQSALEASVLEIEDVSYKHAGHAGVKVGENETHFNIKIVSPKFDGQNLVKRHRMVYELLGDELKSGLHAISIVAKTPQETSPANNTIAAEGDRNGRTAAPPPSPSPGVYSSSGRTSGSRVEWQTLTKGNFSSQIRLHPQILLVVTVPWFNEARTLMKEVSYWVANDEELKFLKLLVINRSSEKMLTDILGAKD